ncbi:hypothetical protein COM77_26650 [Bacillus cereus]|uniref:hypothetical protein n=1 Tax=Bacillus cereus TaxID=1396 RepID=UPI000BEE4091|nr:hypothetical protein [Bacillus cereus]PEB33257.1 hypothetical protein COM77_26650 [Bacillus cereus]
MEKIEYQPDRIATALETIARGLNLSNYVVNPDVEKSQRNLEMLDKNFITHSTMTPEEELFIRTTNIYLDETQRKYDEGLQRKSAIKVSQKLIPMQISFLRKYLPDFTIAEDSSAVLVLSKKEAPKALIRIYTDLGFHRANNWRKDMLQITKIASSLSIPKENITLLVISNLNGLDSSHVSSTLGYKISNKNILDKSNQSILKDYCKRYIKSFSDIFPTPENQIYFLTSALHPNVVAEEIFTNKDYVTDLKNYPWISTPLSKIINRVKSL